MGDRRVIRFTRHPRRHPKWTLGDAPGRSRTRRGRRRSAPKLVLAAVLVATMGPAIADPVMGFARSKGSCTPLALVDGDTMKALCDGRGVVSVRFVSFDTPEMAGRCTSEIWRAYAATWALRWSLFAHGPLTTTMQGSDRYDRVLVRAVSGGVPVARRMIETGLARAYAGGPRAGWCSSQERTAVTGAGRDIWTTKKTGRSA